MADKTPKDDTIFNMSVQDVLDELGGEAFESDEKLSLDEVLAEFADESRNKRKPDAEELELDRIFNGKKEPPKPAPQKPKIKQAPPAKPQQEKTEKPQPANPSKEKPQQEKTKKAPHEPSKKAEDTEPRLVSEIIRPWESGMYGDMKLESDGDAPKKNKKKRVERFSETFDTFTRSELFEEKKDFNILETRTPEELFADNTHLSRMLKLRMNIILLICAALCYLSFAAPLGWPLPTEVQYLQHPFRFLFLTALLQISVMLLSMDIITKGLVGLFRLHPCAESVIAFSSFASLLHVITIMVMPEWHGWLPYSSITSLSLLFALYGKLANTRALIRVFKTLRSAKEPSAVYIEDMYGNLNIIKNTANDTVPFISHVNDRSASATFWTFLAPIVIVSCVVFAAIASFGTRTPQHFFWALAAISSVSAPLFTTLSFSHPFSVASKQLYSAGVAIAGWFAASRLAKRASIIVTDSDLYPKGAIVLHGLKILGNFSLEKTLSYVASVIGETGSGLTDVFGDLLKSHYGETVAVKNLRYHESGGIEAEIGNDVVLVGTSGFMLRNGVRLSSGSNAKSAAFIAINRQPAGVFNINYKGNPEVGRALRMLVRKRVPVILAARDFNILPMMVEKTFDIPEGRIEYPEVEERINLSEREQFTNNDMCAVITRSGLFPFAAATLSARKLRSNTLRNICLTTAGSVIGILVMFYLTFMQRPALITPHTVFIYLLLWWIPTWLLSLRVKI